MSACNCFESVFAAVRLSRSQINIAVPDMQTAFDARLTDILHDKYQPDAPTRRADLAAYVTDARRYVQRLGFHAEQHILDLIEAGFVTGGTLWDDPDFKTIMARRLAHNEDKAVAIRRRFIREPEAVNTPQEAISA